MDESVIEEVEAIKCACGNALHGLNKSGVCKECRTKGQKKKGKRTVKPKVDDDDPALLCTITLDLTEMKMDSIWARQPLTMKGYLIQMLLQDEDEVE